MIEITFKYRPLFSVVFEHTYYNERLMKNFIIAPTSDTLNFLSKNDLLIKNTSSGFNILADYDLSEKMNNKVEMLKNQQRKMSFLLYTRDSCFKNYTELPYETNNKIFYFSNSHLKNKTEGYLHKNKEVGENDLRSLNVLENLKTETVQIQKSGFENETLEVKEYNKNALFGTIADGAYKVIEKSKTVTEFVKFTERVKGQPLAIIEIELNNSILDSISDAISGDEQVTFNYKIMFKARAIQWRYTIVPIRQKKVNDLKIISQNKNSKIKFSENKKTEKDSNHLVFESNTEIEYNETYPETFQLKRGNSETEGKTIIKKLPYPALDFIIPLEKNKYYSEILIYI